MTRQTSLHGWTVPTEGDENYEDTFDDFFVDLDTNGELRDVESNLQNYSPKSGAKFVATDTENRYIGDGSTWNKVASSGKNPNFESIKAGSLTDTQDDQAWETLRDAGFEVGDFHPVNVSHTNTSQSTSSSSFQSYQDAELLQTYLWDTVFPSDVQAQVWYVARVNDGGATITTRFRNIDDGETVASASSTGNSGTSIIAGPTNYTPTTTNSRRRFRMQFRSDDGSTTVDFNRLTLVLGVKV